MSEINSETSLRSAILQLERKRAGESEMLREQFFQTFETIKPVNMLRNGLREALGSRDLKTEVMTRAVGLGAGLLTKILFQRFTRNPVKKMLGTALMFGIADLAAKNPAIVESLGKGIMKIVRGKPGQRAHSERDTHHKA